MPTDKRTSILSAAQRLFQEKGLGISTMEDFAKAAGMGKSSLYYYFKSKEEIFDGVLEMEIGEIVIEIIRQVGQQKDLLSKLKTFAAVKFEMTRKRKSLYEAMEAVMDAESLSHYQELKGAIHLRFLQKETVLLQQILINAVDQKEISQLSADEIDNAVFVFLSALRGINREINQYRTPDEASKRLGAFCQIFYKGIP